jgi:hypothetical protein
VLSPLLWYLPATPHNPNPALRIIDPLFRSATASSASVNNLDTPRSTFGASVSRTWDSVEYDDRAIRAVLEDTVETGTPLRTTLIICGRGRATEINRFDTWRDETRQAAILRGKKKGRITMPIPRKCVQKMKEEAEKEAKPC